jgi:hypothetical protein
VQGALGLLVMAVVAVEVRAVRMLPCEGHWAHWSWQLLLHMVSGMF